MDRKSPSYIPALKYDALTALYDPVVRWTTREATFKRRLVEQAGMKDGFRVLDLGCGTATLTIQVKQAHPGTAVMGLDGDAKILNLAREKVARAGLEVALEQGMAYALPYPDGAFDRVLSSLFFHHLTSENKRRTFLEVFRVLRSGGELHVADWGRPQNLLMRVLFLPVQLLDGFETTGDNVAGRLLDMMRAAGFAEAQEVARVPTVLGTMTTYRARKP